MQNSGHCIFWSVVPEFPGCAGNNCRGPSTEIVNDSSPALPMNILLNKAHFPVTVLGPGRRIGLWLQGCSIRCKDCVSQDTWPADAAKKISIDTLLAWCRKVGADGLDGITISGGEPFDQPQALAALLKKLDAWRKEAGLDFDLLCYSGHPLKTLQKKHAKLLGQLDAVIPEPYAAGRPLGMRGCGSDNQTLVPLSPRGALRYADWLVAPQLPEDKRMQVSFEAGRIWMIGIPHRGDMAALETLCQARGLTLGQVSWR
jgi:anaerobic ribonucleoside-triphosphate reductase activating protein